MGLTGKSTDLTCFLTTPVTRREPRGMRTIWPGLRLIGEE